MLNVSYKFELPQTQKSIIKVIGVGGGGSNAVNYMYNKGIKDVEFFICNTDAQSLKSSPVPNKVQIGANLTEGLGAGSIPEVGKNSALESKEDIRNLLSTDTKMVFITAGMGGGTGTGAAPIIAKIARELDILTVGIVTAPFAFEGPKKRMKADQGISEMKQYCDTVLVILNDKLREIYGNLSIREAFAQADNILTNAAKSIAEIITVTGEVNVDFNDVRTVLKESGAAVMGSGTASGANRAIRAVEDALTSPLLNNTDVSGAKNILISVSYGDSPELTMDEMDQITGFMYEKADYEAEMKFGQVLDPLLRDQVKVTVIATGFEERNAQYFTKTVYDLDSNKKKQIIEDTNIQIVNNPIITDPIVAAYNHEIQDPVLREKQKERENEQFLMQLDSQYIIKDKKEEVKQPTLFEEELLNENRARKLEEQNKNRIAKLKELSNKFNVNTQWSSMKPEELKDRMNTPAYLRKNVNLQDTPHSSERSISRFNLNDDNEILGNNKFLHDNVD